MMRPFLIRMLIVALLLGGSSRCTWFHQKAVNNPAQPKANEPGVVV
ncbi:MAG: hypothetical protein GC205_07065 [Bacteroidetes bacterium]|nr:hypothetical protein [Bacteroidota bacterium]